MSERFAELRESIAASDARVVAEINERLRLVGELWTLKRELGLERLDPDRERKLREELAAVNHGPLSAEGLDALITAVLDLTKRELQT